MTTACSEAGKWKCEKKKKTYVYSTAFGVFLFFHWVFLYSRVTGACPVNMNLILRVHVRTIICQHLCTRKLMASWPVGGACIVLLVVDGAEMARCLLLLLLRLAAVRCAAGGVALLLCMILRLCCWLVLFSRLLLLPLLLLLLAVVACYSCCLCYIGLAAVCRYPTVPRPSQQQYCNSTRTAAACVLLIRLIFAPTYI